MGLLELIVIILLLSWVFGGFLALPITGGLLNFLLAIVIFWIIYTLIKRG